ncbi:hypothetical protein [Staphylococcus phage LY01]|nr:hypothetical protein [Staphylococcus phage LY01]
MDMSKQILNSSRTERVLLESELLWFEKEMGLNYKKSIRESKLFKYNVKYLFEEIIKIIKDTVFIGEDFRFVSYNNGDNSYNNTIYVIYEIGNYPFMTQVSSRNFNLSSLDETKVVGKETIALLHFIKSSIVDNYNIFRFYENENYNYHKGLTLSDKIGRNVLDVIVENKIDDIKDVKEIIKVETNINKPSFKVFLEQDDEDLIEYILEINTMINEIHDVDLLLEYNNNTKSRKEKAYLFIKEKYNSTTYNYSQKSDYKFYNYYSYYNFNTNNLGGNVIKSLVFKDGKNTKLEEVTSLVDDSKVKGFNPFRSNLTSNSYISKLGDLLTLYILLSDLEIADIKPYFGELVYNLFTSLENRRKTNIYSKNFVLNYILYPKRNNVAFLMYMDIDGSNVAKDFRDSSSIVMQVLINNVILNYINDKVEDFFNEEFSLLDAFKYTLNSSKRSSISLKEEIKELYSLKDEYSYDNKNYKNQYKEYYNLFKQSIKTYLDKNGLSKYKENFDILLGDEDEMAVNKNDIEVETMSQIEKFNRRYNNENNKEEQEMKKFFKGLSNEKQDSESKKYSNEEFEEVIKEESVKYDYIIIKDSKLFKDISFKYAGENHLLRKVPNNDIEKEIEKRKLFINSIFENTEFNFFVSKIKFLDGRTIEIHNNNDESMIVEDYYDILTGEENLEDIKPKVTKVKGLTYNIDLIKSITGLDNISKEGNKVYQNGEYLCDVEELMI